MILREFFIWQGLPPREYADILRRRNEAKRKIIQN